MYVQTTSTPNLFGLFMWKFLKSNGFCKVWGKLSAYIKTVFSTDSLRCVLESIDVAFYLQGLFSILSSDMKVTCNCPS